MPIYIELDKQSSFPPASNANKLVLGVNTLNQIVVTDNGGGTTGINNVSSSFAQTASFAQDALFAQTASFIQTAQTASFIQTAQTALFATSASFIQTAQTALFATSASFAQTASFYGGTVSTASFALTAQTLLGSVESASYAATASLLLGSVESANFAISASFATTASFIRNAVSASYVLQAVSASFAISSSRAVTSSFAISASYITPLNQDVIIIGSLKQGSGNITGTQAHAEGINTQAKGYGSHAEGSNTVATGYYSHAEGWLTETGTETAAEASISAGLVTLLSSYGNVTSSFTPGGYLYVNDWGQDEQIEEQTFLIDSVTFNGTETEIQLTNNSVTTTSAVIVDLTYASLNYGAFIGDGLVYSDHSHAEGFYARTFGKRSHAEGFASQTFGVQSHAEGYRAQAIGQSSHAEGNLTQAIGDYSHTEGSSTRTIGESSHAEGSLTITTGASSHAEGTTTFTGFRNSVNIDQLTDVSGVSGASSSLSIIGYNYTSQYTAGTLVDIYDDGLGFLNSDTIFSSSYNTNTTTVFLTNTDTGLYVGFMYIMTPGIHGNYAHAEGNLTQAIGDYSHAEGSSTQAIGPGSHAEGLQTQAIGSYSHAEGVYTVAQGNHSHAEGFGTIASGSYQHVQGQFNITSSVQSAFIIGNGADTNTRSNLVFAAGNQFQVTGSVIATQGFSGSLFGTASFASTAISSSFASTASFYAMPVSAFAFTSGYGNLTNNVDNTMKYDTQVINNRPDIFELSGSGTTDARIFVKQPGIYEFISQINMFDAFNNVDFIVKLNSGSAFGAMGLVSIFNDEKYVESTSARTLNGTIIVDVPTSQYYSVALNPSANSPFPSNNFNTPTRLFIKKLA
jgi:hypothetical protein